MPKDAHYSVSFVDDPVVDVYSQWVASNGRRPGFISLQFGEASPMRRSPISLFMTRSQAVALRDALDRNLARSISEADANPGPTVELCKGTGVREPENWTTHRSKCPECGKPVYADFDSDRGGRYIEAHA